MATKIYLESNGTPAISPTPNGGWTDTSQFTRFNAGTTKGGSAMTTKNISDAISTQADILIGQWITLPLTAGQTISALQMVRVQARFSETSNNNNLFMSWAVYIFNGTTLQATIVAKRNDTTEVVLNTLTNRADTTASAGYTTVAGDQIVIEIGLQGDPSGGNTHNGAMSYGSDSATDLGSNDTDTSAFNPWVNFPSDTLTFDTTTISPAMWQPSTNQPIFEKDKVVSY
jgi:hypothetical protein